MSTSVVSRSSLIRQNRGSAAVTARSELRERRVWPSHVTPGWYVAALSTDIRRGRLEPLTVAERQLVLARSQTGKAIVLDRYCVHQGASLAAGKMVGELVQCPFHHWQYDASGQCQAIPNCSKIPKGAKVHGHPVAERFGLIWIFVGEPELAAKYPLPEASEFHPPDTFQLVRAKRVGTVRTVPKDIVENVVDQGHVSAVHGVKDRPVEAIHFDFSPGRFHSEFTIMALGKPIRGYTTLYPPCFWWTSLAGFGGLHSPVDATSWLFALRPVGPELTECYSACYTTGKRWNPLHRLLSTAMERLWTRGFLQDVRVWDDKVVREEPLLCALDTGPIWQFRKWWADYESRVARADAA